VQKAGALFRKPYPPEKAPVARPLASELHLEGWQAHGCVPATLELLTMNVTGPENKRRAEGARTGLSKNWFPLRGRI